MFRFCRSPMFLPRIILWVTIGILLAIIFVPEAFAADGAMVDLSPLAVILGDYLGVVAEVLVVAALGFLLRWLGLAGSAQARRIEDATRTFVHETVDRGLTRALARMPEDIKTVDVRSQIVADVIEYVQKQAPGALKRLKADPAALGRLVDAKLSEVVPAPIGSSDWGFPIPRASVPG